MSKNVTLWGASYTGVPSLEVPQTGGGTATFTDTSPTTATAADVATGKTFFLADGTQATGQLSGGSTIIVDEEGEYGDTIRHITTGETVEGSTTITTNGTHDVAHYVSAIVNVPSSAPSLQSKTATPTEQSQTVTPDTGYDGLSQVTVGAISSSYVGSGITRRTSSDLTASGATITAPAGYYASAASKSVSSGTAGTPTATKGAVSNHSVTVTPSVTNTTGYITGSTKTGTAVTVSASELVSGTLNVTENGTADVTNYASVDVNVPSSGGSSYELIYSTTVQVSTTSTSNITVATIDTGDTSIWTSDKLVYVKIRDTAGWRANYFYGMDAFCANNVPFNGLSATSSYAWFGQGYSMNSYYRLSAPTLYRNTSGNYAPTGYGIFPTYVYSDGKIQINAQYSSSSPSTQTIDGTFSIEVYLLDWPVASPFNE